MAADTPQWSRQHPWLGTGPIPTSAYFDAGYFDKERQFLFRKVWLHVGRVEELPGTGSYFLRDFPALKASAIVVRGADGEIRAFHNVCSHRCNRLVERCAGKVRRFNCGYHGWSFDPEGRLAGVPQESNFHNLDKSKLGLTPIRCELWQGFIFVSFDPNPAETLREYLGAHYAALEGYPFERFTSCFSWRAEVDANWKVTLDAFAEGYHVAYVHQRSLAPTLQSSAPLAVELDRYHRRLSVGGNPNSVYGNPKLVDDAAATIVGSPDRPIESAALRHGRGKGQPSASASELPVGLNPARADDWTFDVNVALPDFYLSLRPNYYQSYFFRPVAVDRTIFEARVYYPEQTQAGGRFYQEYMKVMLRDVLLEDFSTLERLQQALASGVRREMTLSDNEILVRHAFQAVDGFVQRAGAPGPSVEEMA